MAALAEACENGHDHDDDPVRFTLKHSGRKVSLGFYSRNREINPNSSVVVPKFVVSRTALQGPRLGARAAVMLSHHKACATTAEGPARLQEGSLFSSSGGRQRRLPMLVHRPRDASYPEDEKSDPRYDEFRNHHTSFSVPG